MADAGRTYDIQTGIGNDTGDLLIDFSDSFTGGAVTGTLNGERAAYNGTRITQFVPTSVRVDPSYAGVYTGTATDDLRGVLPFTGDDPWVYFIDKASERFFYVIRSFIPGLPQSLPSTSILTETVPMLASAQGSAYSGANSVAVTKFEFSASTSSASVGGTIPAGSDIFAVVTEYTSGVSAANFTVGSLTKNVGDTGVYKFGTPASAITNATIAAAHTLTGQQKIVGYLCVGEEEGIG